MGKITVETCEIEGLKVYRQEEVIHNIEQELSDICSK